MFTVHGRIRYTRKCIGRSEVLCDLVRLCCRKTNVCAFYPLAGSRDCLGDIPFPRYIKWMRSNQLTLGTKIKKCW